ncbi:uncharacterized protein METZ01_LOCUS31083 [marine metagenome]|uniref:Uncharacterized protein n=1 Tax=marine metagenome TaxID=408172 RepID=A0A381QIJ3_9ZZZZ
MAQVFVNSSNFLLLVERNCSVPQHSIFRKLGNLSDSKLGCYKIHMKIS